MWQRGTKVENQESLILVNLMSQHKPKKTEKDEWVELEQKMKTIQH